MSKARQLVSLLRAEAQEGPKAFLQRIAPSGAKWLYSLGFVMTKVSPKKTEFENVVGVDGSLRYAVRVALSGGRPVLAMDPKEEGVLTVTAEMLRENSIIYASAGAYYAHPERVTLPGLQELLTPLLKRLVSISPRAPSLAVHKITQAFEDTDQGYYQAQADAAHAHGADVPEDEP